MKMASFFMISVAFHVIILTLPVSFFEAGSERVIPIVLYGLAERDGQGPGGTGKSAGVNGNNPSSGPSKRRHHPEKQQENETNLLTKASAKASFFTEDRADEGFTVVDLVKMSVEDMRGISNEAGGEGSGGGSKGEEWNGNAGTGMGFGGSGGGGNSTGMIFAQASYAYNPRPEYPEKARKESWEGTVLLRVLVSPEGKPEKIEVSRGSGFEDLDGAAMKTVKGWRFHPARYGDRRVESWVKIPIVFRLADLKN